MFKSTIFESILIAIRSLPVHEQSKAQTHTERESARQEDGRRSV